MSVHDDQEKDLFEKSRRRCCGGFAYPFSPLRFALKKNLNKSPQKLFIGLPIDPDAIPVKGKFQRWQK